jgi:hypothetical protein
MPLLGLVAEEDVENRIRSTATNSCTVVLPFCHAEKRDTVGKAELLLQTFPHLTQKLAYELTAQAMGHVSWAAMPGSVTVSNKFDESLPDYARQARVALQLYVLTAGVGVSVDEARRFQAQWCLTSARVRKTVYPEWHGFKEEPSLAETDGETIARELYSAMTNRHSYSQRDRVIAVEAQTVFSKLKSRHGDYLLSRLCCLGFGGAIQYGNMFDYRWSHAPGFKGLSPAQEDGFPYVWALTADVSLITYVEHFPYLQVPYRKALSASLAELFGLTEPVHLASLTMALPQSEMPAMPGSWTMHNPFLFDTVWESLAPDVPVRRAGLRERNNPTAGRLVILFAIKNEQDRNTFLNVYLEKPPSRRPPLRLKPPSFCADEIAVHARLSRVLPAYLDEVQRIPDALASHLAAPHSITEVRIRPPKEFSMPTQSVTVELTFSSGAIEQHRIITGSPALTIDWVHDEVCRAGRAYTLAFGDEVRDNGMW